jgi:4'-phosphopantetheinyl transferase EntD
MPLGYTPTRLRRLNEHVDVLAEVVTEHVAFVEAFGDIPGATLYPGEAAAIALAVEKRRQEFATARACARSALATLGVPAGPVDRGPGGAPVWPTGIVGSITHCDGYRAAAVARADDVRTLAIDAEPNLPLPDGVLGEISCIAERTALPPSGHVCWDRLLFSAKECVYKACFPLAGRWLDFEDVTVHIDAVARSFCARIRVPIRDSAGQEIAGFAGRWTVDAGLLATAIVWRPETVNG